MPTSPTRGGWKTGALVALCAGLALLWLVGLPWRRGGDEPGEGLTPAARTAALLREVMPRSGAQGCARWRELSRLGAPEPELSGRIGFDGLRLFFAREDGEVRWTVGLLLDASGSTPRPTGLLVECASSTLDGSAQVARLREAWPHESTTTRRGWRSRWRDLRNAAELEGRARIALGGHVPVEVPAALADAYELLLDPLRPIVYARAEVEAAAAAPGRSALEALLASGRDELVRNALRGLDPEGRLYAAEALIERIGPERDDQRALRRLLELDVAVRVVGATGDAVARTDARAALGL